MTANSNPALYPRLLAAVEHLTPDEVHATGSYMDIKTLLDAGAPTNPPLPTDPSLFAPLIEALIKHDDRLHSHARLLLERGANPMLRGDFNVALVDRDRQDGIADFLMVEMCQQTRAGLDPRDAQGNTPLHICMMAENWGFSDNNEQWMEERIPNDWLNAQNADGDTPLHLIWRDAAEAAGARRQRVALSDLGWKCTRIMIERGARMDLDNHSGQSVAQMLWRCVDRGALSVPGQYLGLVDQARLYNDASRLDQATSPAPLTHKRDRRL